MPSLRKAAGFSKTTQRTKLPLDQMDELGESLLHSEPGYQGKRALTNTAKAEWGKESYPTREYDGITFPSGEYYSLRINLGNAEGENWWCVLFPPLCTNASFAKESLNKMGISKNGTKVYTSKKYTFRFKILEFFKR
jgi:stage II sporulation protein R